ncbi:glycoside hydrolase family 5 protein [Paenibacillus alkalitolerans]|uniref:glycoside hydrolase family 5 protein n=1 Tax=Paenibacillus alkalitolerans TaxID=2799335 RepID=UPI0018F5F48C|nr:glycoside hydrolase family 5 protein [Paenibacillus alkalitolerans]
MMPDPFLQADKLGKGINLGNALEAPVEGQWGVTLQESYFKIIKEGGFDTVRVPIKWSSHAATEPPYTIEEAFAERIDWVIDQAQSQGLNVVINVHHYDELFDSPEAHKDRFIGIWRQIAGRYKDRPLSLYFEPLNEPHGNLSWRAWNDLLADTIAEIRMTDTRRTLIIGTSDWGGIRGLTSLSVPEEEKNAIVTFHYYDPYLYTHQGAEWGGPEVGTTGVTWPGPPDSQVTPADAAIKIDWVKRWFEDYHSLSPDKNPAGPEQVVRDFDKAAAWAKENDRPLWLGEFGAYSKSDMASRVKWTEFVRSEAEKRNIPWAYWEFAAGFGVYDRQLGNWRTELHKALIGGVTVTE